MAEGYTEFPNGRYLARLCLNQIPLVSNGGKSGCEKAC